MLAPLVFGGLNAIGVIRKDISDVITVIELPCFLTPGYTELSRSLSLN
jgi:hypothetical protein